MRNLFLTCIVNTFTATINCCQPTGSTMILFLSTFMDVLRKLLFTTLIEGILVRNFVLTRHMTSGLFTLQSSSKTHTIDFGFTSGKPSSTCADWVRWKFGKYVPCKHIFATFRLVDGWGWASLPDVYKHSPYLSDDSSTMLEYSGSCVPNSAFLIVVLETVVLMKL